jgi:PAS domain S-box-containing protein
VDRLRLESAIADNIGAGVGLVRAMDGEIVYANERWGRLFGYAPDELIGRHISALTASTEQAPGPRAQEISDALDRDGVWSGEVHNVRKDGTRCWTQLRMSPFEHPRHGSVWISVNTDITEAKRARDAVQDSESRFRGVFEDAPLGIVLVDDDLKIMDANRAFSRIVGYGRDELVGSALATIVHPDDRALEAELWERVFRDEIPGGRAERRYVTKQGDPVPVAQSTTVRRAADGRPLHAITMVEEVIRPLS